MDKETEERLQKTFDKILADRLAGDPKYTILERAKMANYNSPGRKALRELEKMHSRQHIDVSAPVAKLMNHLKYMFSLSATTRYKERYIYPAINSPSSNGLCIEFPDFPGCRCFAEEPESALPVAQNKMAAHIIGLEDKGVQLPEASNLGRLVLHRSQQVIAVDIWIQSYRNVIK